MKEDYFGPRGEISRPTEDDFSDISEQNKGYLSPEELGGLPRRIEKKPINWMDKLTENDRARVEEILKDKIAEREEKAEQVGKNYGKKILLDFDKLLSALRVGNLDRAAGNIADQEVVRQALLIGNFSYARSLGEVVKEVWLKEKIVENGRVYTEGEIIKMIADNQIDDLPKFQNLRITVANFLEPYKDYPAGRNDSLNDPDNLGDEWKEGTVYDEKYREQNDEEIKRDSRGVVDNPRSLNNYSEAFPTNASESPLDRFPDISLPGIEKLLRENVEGDEFRGKIASPNQLDWPTLAQDGEWGQIYGEYTIGNEVYGSDFDQAEVFIPDLSFLVGEPFWRVAIYVTKTFGQDYYLPGLIYSRWLLGQVNARLLPINDHLEQIKKQIFGKSCQFFGSVLRNPKADCWSVPYLRFLDGGGFFWDKKLDYLWTEKDCAILLKKPKKS